ncbi:MAG: Tim44 domain-containing protein [Hyphomicrobiales bacterium]|nr:Tim44 domain-containing protein [Hyphomicrobiales bacterium]MDE2114132.1 Tim44 domain-containing protein [Hyphomicrobiales bacterium]
MSTLIFAAIAAFVLWKLWTVLGYRTGNERPPANSFNPSAPRAGDNTGQPNNVVRLPGAAPADTGLPVPGDKWKGFAEPNTPLAAGLDAIAAKDANFAVAPFVKGAKAAYEMIVTAFAAGDRKTLRNLLTDDVFNSFNAAIDAREASKQNVQLTFVSLDKADIETAGTQASAAFITLRYASKIISVTRNAEGAVVEGSPDTVNDHVDVWTFTRDTNSRDQNWRLASTSPDH